MHESASPDQMPASKKRPLILRPTTLLIIVLLGAGGFFAVGYLRSNVTISQLQQVAAKSPDAEANELINKLSKHMALPNEKPTIATVEDTKKLSDQTFFKNAHEGDKVLMYTKAKKAILYRSSEDKVIEVAYLNIQGKEQ